MHNVLFVCLGNICRSPMAEGVLRKRLEEGELSNPGKIDSAGIHGFHAGSSPDPRAAETAMRRGYILDGQRARQVNLQDFSGFDLILAMDFSHLNALKRIRPDKSTSEISLLLDFADNPPQREVPDPYYGGPDGFEYALDLIEAGVAGLIKNINKNL
jgi:protein-tyrosine phosphatase